MKGRLRDTRLARVVATLISGHHWRTRILLWSAAAGVGAAAVGFAWIADTAQLALRRLLGVADWAIWIVAPVGFFCVAWLTRAYFRGSEGSGIPQTIFALKPDAGDAGARLLRLPVVIGRVVLAGAALLCGASIGREGPTVHVGAAIANAFGRWIPRGASGPQHRALVLAGGAAGVAAAFNTPLAGIVFAIEELARSFEERASGVMLTAVVLAGVIAIALSGDYTYFGQPAVRGALPKDLWSHIRGGNPQRNHGRAVQPGYAGEHSDASNTGRRLAQAVSSAVCGCLRHCRGSDRILFSRPHLWHWIR